MRCRELRPSIRRLRRLLRVRKVGGGTAEPVSSEVEGQLLRVKRRRGDAYGKGDRYAQWRICFRLGRRRPADDVEIVDYH